MKKINRKTAFTLADGATHVAHWKDSRKVAFTLAEVLITLAIIGVVAAMTMPTLIQHFQKKSLETQTQRFYSMMSQAVKQYMADYGVDDLRNTPLASDNYEEYCDSPEAIASIRDFVTKYLKVAKECDYDANDCFASVYHYWDGSKQDEYGFPVGGANESRRDYVLTDGAIIRIGYYHENSPIDLIVDVNGQKGPNRKGYDLWTMSIFYDGVIDEGQVGPECRGRTDTKYDIYGYTECKENTPHDKRESRFENECKNNTYGGCFGHFLENNFKFDY